MVLLPAGASGSASSIPRDDSTLVIQFATATPTVQNTFYCGRTRRRAHTGQLRARQDLQRACPISSNNYHPSNMCFVAAEKVARDVCASRRDSPPSPIDPNVYTPLISPSRIQDTRSQLMTASNFVEEAITALPISGESR